MSVLVFVQDIGDGYLIYREVACAGHLRGTEKLMALLAHSYDYLIQPAITRDLQYKVC